MRPCRLAKFGRLRTHHPKMSDHQRAVDLRDPAPSSELGGHVLDKKTVGDGLRQQRLAAFKSHSSKEAPP
jgi:hypothetical protein